jgi:quinol monooxygenase YgiN
MSDLHVVAVITAKPGTEAEVRAAMEAIVAPTRAEDGCVSYFLHASAADPAVFVTVEAWKSQEDLAGHMQTEHIKGLIAAAGDKLAGPPQIHPLIPIN